MNNMPPKLREDCANDSFYERCCVTGVRGDIEWHHNLIDGGKQVQEKFCLLPVAKAVHERADRTEVREILDWIMLNRASFDEIRRHSKARNLAYRRDMLNKKFGRPWMRGIYSSYYKIIKL